MSKASPFATDLFGGLPKTETGPASTSTGDTTRVSTNVQSRRSSSGRARASSSERNRATQSSFGDERDTGQTNKSELNARCSAMKGHASQASLSDRLTQSLITAGLVKGITPSLIRQLSGQPIRVLAFDAQDGSATARQRPASSSLSGCEAA